MRTSRSTVDTEKLRVKPLVEFFGDVPLVDIDHGLSEEYKRYRAPNVQFISVNRELGLMKFLLRCAVKRGVLRSMPLIELQDESNLGNDRRSVTEEEYRAILKHMQLREQQRIVITWWETAMRVNEPFSIKWPMVDLKVGLFRLPGHILKEKVSRRTPLSFEMFQVLEELRDEQRKNKVENIAAHVFTRHDGRPIKDIYKAFAAALGDAKLHDSGITPRSFRRAAISRWTALGIPRDLTMLFSGHRSTNVHDSYLNFGDDVLVKQFKDKGLLLPPQQRRKVSASEL